MKLLVSTLFVSALLVFIQPDPANLPLNRVQVIGSHNSYKQAIDPALFRAFQQRDSASAAKLDYEHIPIPEQLTMGLRNLEIDVYADSAGGRYARPKGLEMVRNQAPYDPAHQMEQPGFKIFHVVDLDFRSHALTLTDCLRQLRAWSDAHPGHTPVFVTLEGKDQALPMAGYTPPEKFTAALFDELDNNLRTGLGTEHLLTPDDLRGRFETLEAAALAGNWPTVRQAGGKFLFILDDRAAKRALYMAGHPSLASRVMFTNADPDTPEAAAMIRNNPKDPAIPGLVRKGYLIRTRADADTRQARQNDRSDFLAACQSGAQIITTDYYRKSTRFSSDYSVSFTDNTYLRINPLFAGSPARQTPAKP